MVGIQTFLQGEGGEVLAFAAIRLDTVRLLSSHRGEAPVSSALTMLDRQMDFLRSLRWLPPGCALELRYLRTDREPHRVQVAVLLRATAKTRAAAAQLCQEASAFVLELLAVHLPLHEFSAVDDKSELTELLAPFAFRDVVEIVRREARIELDTVRPRNRGALGFGGPEVAPRPQPEPSAPPSIYYVFPFALPLEDMERLCNALLLHPHPCLFGVTLEPYALRPSDEDAMERRIHLCEKYAQLTLGQSSEVEQLQPFLRGQASALYKNCSQELLQLRDAAFLGSIHLVSTESVSRSLVAAAGTSLTEHAGHPQPTFPHILEDSFTGGYTWRRPETDSEARAANRTLERLTPTPWIEGEAGPEEKLWRSLYPVGQAAAAFRLPLPQVPGFPGIETRLSRPLPAPSEMPSGGLLLGEHAAGGRVRPVYCQEDDRRRHTYVVGQTGTGKSTLFRAMIQQDLAAGRGVGLIDPHGELIDEVLDMIPREREGDVIVVDPTDVERPVGINVLDASTPLSRDFSVNYLLDVFDLLYDMKTAGGPVFEMYMRNALQLLLEQGDHYTPTVMDVPPVFHDQAFRDTLLEGCRNPYVVAFWRREAAKTSGESELANMSPYVTSKLSRFIYNDLMRGILGQRRGSINFREAMDSGKILLVDLRKGITGDLNSRFLAMMVVGQIFSAALGRTAVVEKASLRDFYLYVDEFQNVATQTFVSILSEARKYRLTLTLTNQYVDQLPEYVVHGILGNVGTLVSFRVGTGDAERLSKAFGGVVTANDLIGLPNWHTYVRTLSDGNVSAPFDMRTVRPASPSQHSNAGRLRQLSRQHYGRERALIEAELRVHWEGSRGPAAD